MPDCSQVADLCPCVLKHCRSDESASNLLTRCRHIPFEKQRKSKLARGAVFPLLIAKSLGDLECGFPVATHWYGINFPIDVATDH